MQHEEPNRDYKHRNVFLNLFADIFQTHFLLESCQVTERDSSFSAAELPQKNTTQFVKTEMNIWYFLK